MAQAMRRNPLICELAAIRRELGIAQTDLSLMLGYSKNCVQRWETGTASPSLVHLIDWCQGLGVSLSISEQSPKKYCNSSEERNCFNRVSNIMNGCVTNHVASLSHHSSCVESLSA